MNAKTVRAGVSREGVETENPLLWEPSLAFLKYAIAVLLAGSVAFMATILIVAPDQTARYAGPAVASLVAVTTWLLLSRRRTQAAVYVLVIGTWMVITATFSFLWWRAHTDSHRLPDEHHFDRLADQFARSVGRGLFDRGDDLQFRSGRIFRCVATSTAHSGTHVRRDSSPHHCSFDRLDNLPRTLLSKAS